MFFLATSRHTRFHGRIGDPDRPCDAPGCDQPGEFRAPPPDDGHRDGPPRWRWLCLDHVRAFNSGYNYFDGMDAEEIRAAQHPLHGWAESQPWARGPSPPPRWADFADPIDAIGARFTQSLKERAAEAARAGPPLTPQDRSALKVLGLGGDATRTTIRKAYSALVRRYHPDRNGGDRSHEKRLQAVIEAYTHLRRAPAFT